jgi:hypothetical protein
MSGHHPVCASCDACEALLDVPQLFHARLHDQTSACSELAEDLRNHSKRRSGKDKTFTQVIEQEA